MNLIPCGSIIIRENRQRQEFEPVAMQELKASIEDRGLLHAPVLRKESDGWVLVAGERRLLNIMEIYELGGHFKYDGVQVPDGMCPYTNLGDLNELEAEEAELDENLKRRDLTWQEHAVAVSRLHSLRGKQRAAIVMTTRDDDGQPVTVTPIAQSYADTALELLGRSDGSYQDTVRKEVLVSKHLENPAIAKAKSADEAFKILKRQEETAKNVELARVVGKTFDSSLHKLLHMNCLDYMKSIVNAPEEEKFDVILTDPPYGMGADQFADAGGKLTGIEHRYDDSYESWVKLMTEWCPLSFQVAKAKAHAYVFCDFDRFHDLKKFMQDAGWYVFRTPFIIHKINSGRVPLPDQGPRRQYEIVLYAIKGKKQTTHIYPDVISSTADENFSHGAQKPVAVYQNLLQRSVKPGDRIADFFVGSGTIFEAAHSYRCIATGTEQVTEYYGMSSKRLAALSLLESGGALK